MIDEISLDYVITVLKGEIPDKTPDWYAIVGFLTCHRIVGLFYNRAKKAGVMLPKKIEKIFADTFARQKRKNAFMRRQIKAIEKNLFAASAAHILVKGSVLSNLSEENITIYEDGERISNDIDILVNADGISAVSKALYGMGFVQGYYDAEAGKIVAFSRLEILKRRMNRGEVAPFVKLTGNKEFPFLEVDVNFSLGNTPEDGGALLAYMIGSAKKYRGKAELSVPSEELFFLHLIMHQYKESRLLFMVERGKDLDLYKLADIYYLLKAGTIELAKVKKLAKKFAVEERVGLVLRQVGEIFDDKEIVRLAEKYPFTAPQILDFESKKAYEWTVSVGERIRHCNTKRFLKEVSAWS